jgi:hypothetical protein
MLISCLTGPDRELIKRKIAESIRIYLFGKHLKITYFTENENKVATGDVSSIDLPEIDGEDFIIVNEYLICYCLIRYSQRHIAKDEAQN